VGRWVCGLLAVVHVAPLVRLSRQVLEEGPTPILVATAAVLALLIGVLAVKAAGLVFLHAGSRRASLIALVVACGLFHYNAIVATNAAPITVAIVGTVCGGVAVPGLGRRLRDQLAGTARGLGGLLHPVFWGRLGGDSGHGPLCLVGLGVRQARAPPS